MEDDCAQKSRETMSEAPGGDKKRRRVELVSVSPVEAREARAVALNQPNRGGDGGGGGGGGGGGVGGNAPPPPPPIQVPDAFTLLQGHLHVHGGPAIEIRPSTIPGAGYGVFALVPFQRGDPITAYEGELLTMEEARERRDIEINGSSHLRAHIQHRYVLDGKRRPDGTLIVNPVQSMVGHGVAAFVNSVLRAGDPRQNIDFDYVDSPVNMQAFESFARGGPDLRDPAQRITYVKATRRIEAGEELFAWYGEDYNWNDGDDNDN